MRNVERLQNTLEREDIITNRTGISLESQPIDTSLIIESTAAFQELTRPYQELAEEVVEECVLMWNEEDGEEQEESDL